MFKFTTTLLGAGILTASLAMPMSASAAGEDEALAFIAGAALGYAVNDGRRHGRHDARRDAHYAPVHYYDRSRYRSQHRSHRPYYRPYHQRFERKWKREHYKARRHGDDRKYWRGDRGRGYEHRGRDDGRYHHRRYKDDRRGHRVHRGHHG